MKQIFCIIILAFLAGCAQDRNIIYEKHDEQWAQNADIKELIKAYKETGDPNLLEYIEKWESQNQFREIKKQQQDIQLQDRHIQGTLKSAEG